MANILLVEDEQWLGELYARLLAKAGHDVRWCRDGYDAIGLIDQQPPEVVVLDLLLPWANGLQLLHELASHGDLSHIAVIICSNALPKHIEAKQLAHYGVVAMLDKSTMHPSDLVRVVNQATNHARVSD